MRNFNIISSLFGGNNSGAFGGINLNDYASIKNGSYGKLMKSYFPKSKAASNKNTSSTDKPNNKTKIDDIDKSGLSKVKTTSDSLKDTMSKLTGTDLWKQTGGAYDKEKITASVKQFVSDYNNVTDAVSKTESKDASQNVKFMSSMTSTMSKALDKIGVTVGVDGKLSVNEEKLANADMKNVKALFAGQASYGSQVEKYASSISSAATRDASLYDANGKYSNSLGSTFNQWI